MPELAAIYGIGLIACLLLTAFFSIWSRSRRNSPARRLLTSNLQKAGLYWSENLDQIVPSSSEHEINDEKATQRNIWLTGGLLSALSWAGAFFLFVIILSYRFLARSRLERRLFASQLATSSTLSSEEARSLSEQIARDCGR